MACNRETSADAGASRPPAPATPGSCPNPDVLAPCCDNNCRLSTMTLCPECYRERLLKEESAFNVSKQQKDFFAEPAVVSRQFPAVASGLSVADIRDAAPGNFPSGQDDKKDLAGEVAAPAMADMSDLRVVMKSAKRYSSRRKVSVSTLVQSSGSSVAQGERIPSPLLLSPPLHQGESVSSSAAPPSPEQRSAKRCAACCKRVGLIGFKCRCGDLFCASHRYSDKHDCSFDYKAAGRVAIAKENPVVIASKINKI